MIEERKNYSYKYFNNLIIKVLEKLKLITFPGFEKVPLYDVFSFFAKGLQQGSLNIRATAIAFNFLLALGPALIFFLTILPYLPINNFQENLEFLLFDLIPTNSYIAIEPLLDEIFHRRGGLPIFGLLTSLFFAQKGIHGIIEAFNATFHTLETRSWYRQRIASIGLVFVFYALITIASSFFVIGKGLISTITDNNSDEFGPAILNAVKWIIMVSLTFMCISTLYYFGPSRKTRWKFFSAGSTLSTILAIIASLGFTYFMNHFAQLNKFFGSIGAIIALMLWMNFNALTLLIGFELNASINNAQLKSSQ